MGLLRGAVRRDDESMEERRPAAAAGPGSPTLRMRTVSKTFHGAGGTVLALDDVSLEVAAGEFVCFVGPSGCGKSTLLNLIAGLYKPSQGQIMMGARAISGPGADRVVMFQESALFPWLDVRDNVEFGLSLAGVPRKERERRSDF